MTLAGLITLPVAVAHQEGCLYLKIIKTSAIMGGKVSIIRPRFFYVTDLRWEDLSREDRICEGRICERRICDQADLQGADLRSGGFARGRICERRI